MMETERLILRKWNDGDVDSLFRYASDPEVGYPTGWPAHTSREQSAAVLQNVLNGKECYAICLKETNEAVGDIELKLKGHTDMTDRDDECEVGFWLGKPLWGRGYMTEACREMLRHAFEDLGMKAVWCGYYAGNERSKRVQQKLGFVHHHVTEDLDIPLLKEKRTGYANLLTREKWIKENKVMKIERCSEVRGLYFNIIPGQNRYCYGHSDYEEFFEMPDWVANGGYQGSTIHFMDLTDNQVYVPFEKERNVLYGNPVFTDGHIWFLKGDFNENVITLFSYLPSEGAEEITTLKIADVNLYNLSLTGNPVHIISQRDTLVSYYPEEFEIALEPNETVDYVRDGLVYISAWYEDGVEDGHITDKYQYYNKVKIKDTEGNLISEELGCLNQYEDGIWRIS